MREDIVFWIVVVNLSIKQVFGCGTELVQNWFSGIISRYFYCYCLKTSCWYFVVPETTHHFPFIFLLVRLFLAQSLGLLPAAIKWKLANQIVRRSCPSLPWGHLNDKSHTSPTPPTSWLHHTTICYMTNQAHSHDHVSHWDEVGEALTTTWWQLEKMFTRLSIKSM